MAGLSQRSKSREAAPAPRKKITIALTPSQAEQLRALWQEHSVALHAMLLGWCGDAQNASDILQEVFRRLAEAPSIMNGMKNARAFLAVSARRLAVDFARRSTTRSGYHSAAGAEAPTAENPGPTDEDLRAAIRVALKALPAEQRSIFDQKVLRGRTLEEISRLEGISLNTAASRLRYALDKMRGELRPYYNDLNRSQFKNMKNDLNQDLSENKRIITPLEPKRFPSVVPGLEGLAALSADAGVSDAPAPEQAEHYALPAVEESAPEFVEPRVHIDPVFVEPPTGGIDPVPESFGEQASEDSGDGAAFAIPELISCEIFPPDGEIPAEWLRPFEVPEEFLVTIFEGEGETDVVDGSEEVATDYEGVPHDREYCALPFDREVVLPFDREYCVLPFPDVFVAEVDPQEYIVRYDAFLADNPDWGALDPDMAEAQVITPSSYFSELEFGTPSKAAAFDSWYEAHYGDADGSGTISSPDLSADGQPGEFTSGTADQPEHAGGLSGGTPSPQPAAPPDVANQNGGNGVSSDSNALASTDVNRTSEDSSKDLSGINPVALTERMTVSEATIAALPVEVAIDAQEAADRMMIVEFSVLSPSEAPAAQPILSATQDVGDLPSSVVHGGDTPDLSRGGDAEAAFAPGTDDASARGQADQAGAVAALASQKHDPTTVAAGAVAVGSLAHGSGASAGASRRSLLKL